MLFPLNRRGGGEHTTLPFGSSGRFWRSGCLAVFLLGATWTQACLAEQAEPPHVPEEKREIPQDNYCGVYCVYSLLKLAGKDAAFQDLVQPEYIGSRMGSSIAELKRAAEDHGLFTLGLKNVTTTTLREAQRPIILHVKRKEESLGYNHYVLFLGSESDKAIIYDPPRAPRLEPFYALAPTWSGRGLLVSTEPIDAWAFFAPARKRLFWYVGLCAVGVALGHGIRRWWKAAATGASARRRFIGAWVQLAFVCAFALAAGLLYHLLSTEGFLARPDATASIKQAHLPGFLPKVGPGKAQRLLKRGALFVDARYTQDYEAGHIERAINIPVNGSDEARRNALSSVANDAPLVIYCQSAKCPFALRVARKLYADGYADITIFEGGWLEWKNTFAVSPPEQSGRQEAAELRGGRSRI